MKIRIDTHTLRFRCEKDDLQTLCKSHFLSLPIRVQHQLFIFSIRASDTQKVHAHLDDKGIYFDIPAPVLQKWLADKDPTSSIHYTPENGTTEFIIERDFKDFAIPCKWDQSKHT